jgi:hypothetical protein
VIDFADKGLAVRAAIKPGYAIGPDIDVELRTAGETENLVAGADIGVGIQPERRALSDRDRALATLSRIRGETLDFSGLTLQEGVATTTADRALAGSIPGRS